MTPVLADTHTIIWYLREPAKLSSRAEVGVIQRTPVPDLSTLEGIQIVTLERINSALSETMHSNIA